MKKKIVIVVILIIISVLVFLGVQVFKTASEEMLLEDEFLARR